MKQSEITAFQKKVYDYYKKEGRKLPWRSNPSEYNVFISEIMLQQTQVPRVIEKFTEWKKHLPDFKTLHEASLVAVMAQWQGLGYNRRAKHISDAAHIIHRQHKGKLPDNIADLESLPGIGPATARSIYVYAYNRPIAYIETNIRAVFIYEFFKNQEQVSDNELLPLVELTIDEKNPRKWYSALMDYGTHIKKTHKNPARKSKHYAKQSKFEGSDRQIRGKIIKLLTTNQEGKKEDQIISEINDKRTHQIIEGLIKEDMIIKENDVIKINDK